MRSMIKYQVASSWFFDSSVITMTHGPINIRWNSNWKITEFLSWQYNNLYGITLIYIYIVNSTKNWQHVSTCLKPQEGSWCDARYCVIHYSHFFVFLFVWCCNVVLQSYCLFSGCWLFYALSFPSLRSKCFEDWVFGGCVITDVMNLVFLRFLNQQQQQQQQQHNLNN